MVQEALGRLFTEMPLAHQGLQQRGGLEPLGLIGLGVKLVHQVEHHVEAT